MHQDFTELKKKGIDIKSSVRLSDFTTFRLGGMVSSFFDCQSPEQLMLVLKKFSEQDVDFILIGGGSNLLVSDQGVEPVVVRFLSPFPAIQREDNDLIVSASTLLDDLVSYAISEGLDGLTYASGIPGTVGGGVVGNAGAFGKQIGDVLAFARIVNRNGVVSEVDRAYFDFGYRYSKLKESQDILLSARFHLYPGDKSSLLEERENVLTLRRQKHPDYKKQPCAGSFFRNIEPRSNTDKRQAAGWFLEQAGAKQLSVGGAKVFSKHANIIVKSDSCTAQDVYDLSVVMAKAVQERFHLSLVREVRLVGHFAGKPQDIKNVIW